MGKARATEMTRLRTQSHKTLDHRTNQGIRRRDKVVKGKVSYISIFIHSADEKRDKKDNTMLGLAEIPAKEIKLAKILMDKPAPHCSAHSWAIFD